MIAAISLDEFGPEVKATFIELLQQGFPPKWATLIVNFVVLLDAFENQEFLSREECDLLNNFASSLFNASAQKRGLIRAQPNSDHN